MTTLPLLEEWLATRLEPAAREWQTAAAREIGAGVADDRFGALLSAASRHVRRVALAPTDAERRRAQELMDGFEPERWTLPETLRIALVFARPDLAQPSAVRALETAFQFADEGELCALYRSLAHLPDGGRFQWRAGEGCRSNMRSVFEATACDTPFPARWFDEVAFNQCVVKAIFVGAPVWRIVGLDRRLTPELARMALDLADERRSAGRPVQHELWLAVGPHGGARAVASLERELDPANGNPLGRRAAAYGLARAGETRHLDGWIAREKDPIVQTALRDARAGHTGQRAFATMNGME